MRSAAHRPSPATTSLSCGTSTRKCSIPPVASDLTYVVSKEDAIGVHFGTIHAIARELGSGTRWLVQEIELVSAGMPASVDEDDDLAQLLAERNQR